MIRKTSSCGKVNHREFRISVDQDRVIGADVDWLIRTLEDTVRSGECFLDGQSFQIGWMFTQIRANEDSTLSILEPDMRSFPIAWTDSVTATLTHLRLQKDTCASVFSDESLCFPSILESAIICKRFGKSHEFMMDRTETSNRVSGWFFGCLEKDHDHQNTDQLDCVSLYAAATSYHGGIIPFVALPVGTLVTVQNKIPTIWFSGKRMTFRPGSQLDRLYGNR